MIGRALDKAAAHVGVDYIAGYSALVHKGLTKGGEYFIRSIPEVLSSTERVCTGAPGNLNGWQRATKLRLPDVARKTRIDVRLPTAQTNRSSAGPSGSDQSSSRNA